MSAHPVVAFMVAKHGKDDTPIGALARKLLACPYFPEVGGRKELHDFLASNYATASELAAFNESWLDHSGGCLSPGCPAELAPGSSYCRQHGGRRHHPEGAS